MNRLLDLGEANFKTDASHLLFSMGKWDFTTTMDHTTATASRSTKPGADSGGGVTAPASSHVAPEDQDQGPEALDVYCWEPQVLAPRLSLFQRPPCSFGPRAAQEPLLMVRGGVRST
jgi:hypothetical protein